MSGTRRQCRGTFYDDRASAERACAQQKLGWCCLPGYKVAQLSTAACAARKGTYYPDERTARARCTVVE
jgi:hypothetical protein